jgi:Flp pilus assembly protein TadB
MYNTLDNNPDAALKEEIKTHLRVKDWPTISRIINPTNLIQDIADAKTLAKYTSIEFSIRMLNNRCSTRNEATLAVLHKAIREVDIENMRATDRSRRTWSIYCLVLITIATVGLNISWLAASPIGIFFSVVGLIFGALQITSMRKSRRRLSL